MPKKLADNTGVFWRAMVGFWTIVLFGLVIWDFATNTISPNILGPVCAIYVIALSLYSADKEFERWHDLYEGRHIGEVYVLLWTLLVFGILAIDFAEGGTYIVPSEVVSTYVVVLGILAITKRSKELYKTAHHEE